MPRPSSEHKFLSVLIRHWPDMVFLILALSFIMPFDPGFPAARLDPSWILGMNQAVVDGRAFGLDIIFTHGPSFMGVVKMYHPETFTQSLIYSLYLTGVLVVAVELLVLRWGRKAWLPLIIMIIFGFRFTQMLGLIFLIGLSIISTTNTENGKPSCLMSIAHGFLLSGLGFLCLVKGSMAIFAVMVAGIVFLNFCAAGRFKSALVTVICPTAALVIFWLIAGQTLANLPAYIQSIALITEGYSEAMVIKGKSKYIAFFLISALVLLYAFWRQKDLWGSYKIGWLVLALVGSFIFISFKAGFVRYDAHALTAASTLTITALSLLVITREKKTTYLCIIAIVLGLLVSNQYITPLIYEGKFTVTRLGRSLNNLGHLIGNPNYFRDRYEQVMGEIKTHYNLPILPGTSDIYSTNQTALIASGNKWNPRPIFQSYSAYNPKLIEINRRHLSETATSPDNIFFKVETIDGRLDSVDDGASWPELLSRYQSTGFVGEYLVLRKNSDPGPTLKLVNLMNSHIHTFDEWVEVPGNNAPVFCKLTISKNLWGRLITLAYKVHPLAIEMKTESGVVVKKRIDAPMTSSGFIISPLIGDTDDFAKLYDADEMASLDRVVAFRVLKPKRGLTYRAGWSETLSTEFEALKPASTGD